MFRFAHYSLSNLTAWSPCYAFNVLATSVRQTSVQPGSDWSTCQLSCRDVSGAVGFVYSLRLSIATIDLTFVDEVIPFIIFFTKGHGLKIVLYFCISASWHKNEY
jgi:hypothetical protein